MVSDLAFGVKVALEVKTRLGSSSIQRGLAQHPGPRV